MEFGVLGGTEARRDGDLVRLRGPKQRRLLAALLMAEGEPVGRSRLAAALWTGDPPADPAHALQAHVSRLRAALDVAIVSGPGGYRLDLAGATVDAAEFVRLSTRGRRQLAAGTAQCVGTAAQTLREALALWRGPAFADLAGVDHVEPARARLEELRRQAHTDRIDADLRRAAADGAIGAGLTGELEGLVSRHPLRERHWAQLMVALQLQDRTGEALETYQRARRVLTEQLGADPGALLSGVHQAILRGEPYPADGPLGPGGVSRVEPGDVASMTGGETVLVGRERALGVLESAWAEAGRGLRLVTVSGDAGIGKTRLVEVFAARLAAQGVRVLGGRCDQALATPYQPFLTAVRADVAGLRGAALRSRLGDSPEELVRLLPELAGRVPDLPLAPHADPQVDLQRTFAAVAGWLTATTIHRPTLLVLDDLHWADHQTLMLVRFLVRDPSPARVLLVATVRDREHTPQSPAAALLGELMRQSDRVRHLPLAGLTEEAISTLLDAELTARGASPRCFAGLSRQVVAASAGNPLFAVELARHVVDRGGPRSVLDEVPAGLRQVIGGRMAQLPPDVAELLRNAAVIGKEFDPLVLQTVAGLAETELDDLLQAASYTRLIEAMPGHRLRYAFSHDVVRSVLYDAISPVARARIHHSVAAAIEDRHADELAEHHAELAHHCAAAAAVGSVDRAVHYLMLAGAEALEQRAPWLAREHCRRALDLVGNAGSRTRRCDLLTALGIAAFHIGDASYREILLDAAHLARDLGDGPRLVRAVVANSRGWWSSTGEIDHDRVALIEFALDLVDADDREARVQLLTAWTLENVRDPARRSRVLQKSLTSVTMAEEIGEDHLLATTLSHRYAVVYATFSDPHGCVELAERILALARAGGDLGLRLNGLIGLAQSSMLLGDFDVADRALDEVLELGHALDQPARLWLARSWHAMRLATRGDLEGAETAAIAAFELGAATDQPDAATWFAGQLYTLRMLAGRLPELIDGIEEQVATQAGGIPAWRAAYALALTTVGRQDEAAAILEEFLDAELAPLPMDLLWLHGMTYLGEVCVALRRTDAAGVLYAALAPYEGLLAHNGTIDAGPVDLTLARIARIAGEPEVAEKHLAAAELVCRRIDAPGWLARVRAEQRRLRGAPHRGGLRR